MSTAQGPVYSSRAPLVLAGTCLLSFALGSVHAFSVLLPAVEGHLGVSRSLASLTYSFALIALATMVLTGHRFYEKVTPLKFAMATGALATLGCVVAAFSDSIAMVWLGYSLLFGGANGLGYGYALQFSALALPARKGFAMGAVTAAYAFGAVVFPLPLNHALSTGGWQPALLLLAFGICLFSLLSAFLLSRSRLLYRTEPGEERNPHQVKGTLVTGLWCTYGCAVIAGLMAIGHATGITTHSGANKQWVALSPAVIAASNMTGSLICGVLLDKLRGQILLVALALSSAVVLALMAAAPVVSVTVAGLSLIGFVYGGTISVYPALISKHYGTATGSRVYGKVFTAWAVAGLIGPGSAAFLFDRFQNYAAALGVASVFALLSALVLVVPIDKRAVSI